MLFGRNKVLHALKALPFLPVRYLALNFIIPTLFYKKKGPPPLRTTIRSDISFVLLFFLLGLKIPFMSMIGLGLLIWFLIIFCLPNYL